MDNKNITLLACDIENGEISKNNSDLYKKLKIKLEDKNLNAEVRRMKLNSNSEEEDLLSDFAISEFYIYGVMFRIAPAKESPSIPDDLFKHNIIKINEIKNQEQNSNLICKDHYYFALNKSVLVTSLPKSKIKTLQTYLNWLLNATDYKITPKVKSPDEIKLGEIRKIEFKDSKSNTGIEEINKASIIKMGINKIKDLLVDVPSLSSMFDERIISAKLLLKFSDKPKNMIEEDYAKLLGYMMKPISDDDGITIKLKNGKKISGSNIVYTKVVSIEKIDDFKISEQELLQEMIRFLKVL